MQNSAPDVILMDVSKVGRLLTIMVVVSSNGSHWVFYAVFTCGLSTTAVVWPSNVCWLEMECPWPRWPLWWVVK